MSGWPRPYGAAMADSSPPPVIDRRERDEKIIAEFRANGGRIAGIDAPLVLITTTGAKSGKRHTKPVCVREDGDDLVIAGSMGGSPTHPQWYRNLRAEPEVDVEYLGDSYRARAELVPNSEDRNRLFDMMSEVIIGLYSYQDRAAEFRQIPVVRLVRVDGGTGGAPDGG
jgi:deazaflavin-dependent oxidoreductase (nitroreductase family)